MASERDPRDVVTPDAFSVAPHLLGVPLARPWRRAAAMLVDLGLVALLAHARAVFLALAAGVFLFWLAVRGRREAGQPVFLRASLGCLGAIILSVSLVVVWVSSRVDSDTVLFEARGPEGRSVPVTLGAMGDLTALLRGGDTASAAAAAERLVGRLADQGMSAGQMRAVLDELAAGDDATVRWVERAIGAVGEEEVEAPSVPLDSLLARYERARTGGDTVAEARLAEALGTRLAAPRIAERESEIVRVTARAERLEAQLDSTRAELEAERDRGVVQAVVGFLDELGLGIGWSGLYFTFLTGFLRGRTPGKRLLGIRVVRLDGRPLTYWAAFERFGGYAASLFTGLEGFARILWDRNRQGLEDKLAETVVIRETREVRERLSEMNAA